MSHEDRTRVVANQKRDGAETSSRDAGAPGAQADHSTSLGNPDRLPHERSQEGPAFRRAFNRTETTIRKRRRPRRGAMALGALLVVAAAVLSFRFALPGLPEGAAMRVGDTVVTEQDLRDRVENLRALYGIQAPASGPDADRFWRDAAKAVAVSRVVGDAAEERGLAIADRAVQDTLKRMVDQQLGPNGRDEFVRLLADVGVSEADVLNEIRLQQLTGRLFADVTASVPRVNDADVRARYDRDPAAFVEPEHRHLRNIIVSTQAEADALLAEARGGKDFGALATERTLDASTREAQGDLGFVRRDRLEAPYGDMAFGARVGEVFGPIQTKHGWNVGKVLEVRPATQLRFEQTSAELRSALDAERINKAWRDFLAERIRNADVDYAQRYRPAEPDTPPNGH